MKRIKRRAGVILAVLCLVCCGCGKTDSGAGEKELRGRETGIPALAFPEDITMDETYTNKMTLEEEWPDRKSVV